MKSLTAVRKKSPNYPVEFKIKMVELSHRPEISVAQLAREHGINDNLLFKWRQYWREGKLRRKRAARTVLTGMCYSVGSATRQGSSSPTRFIGQSAMTSRT
ncbi:transposase [Escherichia coli]|nr:transposase [Escherichia coli]